MEQGIDPINLIKERFGLTGADPAQYSPLSLAFLGDSIYGAIVKSIVVLRGNAPANTLDRKAVRYIKAVSQSEAADMLIEGNLLSEEETAIYRRGRNAKSPTSAKNAPVGDYRKATGLEALIGYLYLKGDMNRIIELMQIIISRQDED